MGLKQVLTASALFALSNASKKHDWFDNVDPLIGSVDGGHVFPGANMPYSMAKAVADVDEETQGGFASNDASITGFSHMHDSGTGGGASLGNFPLFPHMGCPDDDINKCEFIKPRRAVARVNGSAVAKPGYFSVAMNNSVSAEMTTANHTAFYKFKFDSGSSKDGKRKADDTPYSPVILVDLTDLADTRSKGNIKVDQETGRISGNGTFSPSFGIGTYELHFCADFKGAKLRDSGVWINNRAGNSSRYLELADDGNNSPPLPGGAWVQFEAPKSDEIMARVGVSFISVDQACSNAEKEIKDWDFQGIRDVAEDAWREKLGVISVDAEGVNKTMQRTFWSGLYRLFISPQDYTGENPLWKSDEPYFDSFYCIWDSFRSSHPLLTLLDPHAQAMMVRSLLDTYKHEGKLPDCRMSLCKGFSQGGSNADNLLADSWVKGLKDGIDWDLAYEAVISDAEEQPAVWTVGGRGGLESWKTLGYVPTDDFDPVGDGLFTRSISRTIEYSINDFCIAEMARDMGKHHDAEKYLKRSKNWKNMFDKDSRSIVNTTEDNHHDSGFKGFLQPRYANGTFGYQDPKICSRMFNFDACYLNPDGHETYEAGSWIYSFYVPHDQASLIPTLGGPETFVDRLQFFHDTPGLFNPGNEQAYLMFFLFHFAGRPGLASKYTHKHIPGSFNDTLAGLPGNDDSGAMGAFTAMTMMGFYPNSGQDVYLITAPFFKEVKITNPGSGKTATIKCKNFDADYKNIYIQSAKMNGKKYTKSWLTHEFFTEGHTLELVLGPHESTSWGTKEEDYPPSASTHFWGDE